MHNYSTRRNRGGNDESGKDLSPEPIIEKAPAKGEKEEKRIKKKETGPLITYEQLGIKTISEFDYKNYNEVIFMFTVGLVQILR